MSSVEGFRQFRPSGPVCAAFIHDQTSVVKMMLGPVGGGKTVGCIFDSVNRPSRWMPPCNDGVIRYRRVIAGITYGQIERNLYPSWWRWLPKDPRAWTEGEWTGGGGRFAIQSMQWKVLRGNRLHEVRAEYLFAAVGDQAVEEFMRGLEPTDFYLYEADQHAEAMIDVGVTRLMRYPPTGDAPDAISKKVAETFQPQIVGDLNAPDVDSWFYRKFEEDRPEGMRLYKQPSGRTTQAENLANLPPGYYERQVELLSKQRGGKHLVGRMVDARYGPSRIGDPVYEDYFDDSLHLARDVLKALPNVPLILGFDQGLGWPACIGAQRTPKGQTRVLFEISQGRMGSRKFAQAVRDAIHDYAPGVPLADVHFCDPAGFTGADTENGELAWAQIVAAELGIVILPTDTNEIEPRLTAVTDELSFLIEPGVPAFVMSAASAPMLRKGFVSHYMYEKRPAEKSQTRKPIKNPWANPHDALQYLLLGVKGSHGVIQGRRDPSAPERAIGHKARRLQADDDCVVVDAPVVM